MFVYICKKVILIAQNKTVSYQSNFTCTKCLSCHMLTTLTTYMYPEAILAIYLSHFLLYCLDHIVCMWSDIISYLLMKLFLGFSLSFWIVYKATSVYVPTYILMFPARPFVCLSVHNMFMLCQYSPFICGDWEIVIAVQVLNTCVRDYKPSRTMEVICPVFLSPIYLVACFGSICLFRMIISKRKFYCW